MILLNSTSSLEVLLAGAVATSQPVIFASGVDISSDASAFSPLAPQAGTTNSTTAVTLLSAPASGTIRQVKYLSIYNADTAPVTATIRVNAGGTPRILLKATIASGERLEYVDGAGFQRLLTGSAGDVYGPASSTADRIAVFDGATGKLIKDGGKTIADLRAPAIQSVTSSATVTPTFSDDLVKITAQAAGLTLANPTGTAIPGLGIVIRIKDNGTARSISYGTQYRAIGITLPTTTVVNKTTYIAMIYNSDDTKWDCIATGTEA